MITALLFLGISLKLGAPEKTNYLVNPGFESGLKGWKSTGDVRVGTAAAIQGKASLVIGKSGGTITQKYRVPGERVIYVAALFQEVATPLPSKLAVECRDRAGKLLMVLDTGAESGKAAAIYLKTHPFTRHLVVRIESTGGAEVLVDDVQLFDEARGVKAHAPEGNLDEDMIPFWEGDTVRSESVLLLGSKDASPSGRLLFAPNKIISVTDSTERVRYREGVDFHVAGRELQAISNSRIPAMQTSEFSTDKYPWTRFDGCHVLVTYEHRDKWQGPRPVSQALQLPRVNAKLRAGKPMTMVAFGDSITLGVNVSGVRNAPPYLPAWPSLVARSLGKVKLYNVALGGMNSQWAKDSARDLVGTTNPDLVLIAFGMNDFWSLTPQQFAANIRAAIANIREKQPACEFVLISPMKFLPSYTTESPYVENLAGYAAELRAMSGPGIAFFDMTAMSHALYDAKRAEDLVADPLHPTDFLARVYAQGVVATIRPK